jgi:hypothetical protein
VSIGDDLDGIIARDQLKTLAEVAEWLRASAVEHYPDSQFAEKHARDSPCPKSSADGKP